MQNRPKEYNKNYPVIVIVGQSQKSIDELKSLKVNAIGEFQRC